MPEETSEPEKAGLKLNELDLQQPSLSEEDLPPSLTDDQIAEIGQRAATALSDPTWQETFKLTLNQVFADWLQTEITQTQEREALWHRAQSLFNLEEILLGQINSLQQINLSKQEQAEEDLNHFENIQGFGLDDIFDTLEPH